jgi:hypothetical protein
MRRLCVTVTLLALTSMASAQTQLLSNGNLGINGSGGDMTGWIPGNSGWGENLLANWKTSTSTEYSSGSGVWFGGSISDHSTDPIAGMGSTQMRPAGIHWIYQHLSNLTPGATYNISGKIAGGFGDRNDLGGMAAGTVLNWRLGYALGGYDPSLWDGGLTNGQAPGILNNGLTLIASQNYTAPADGSTFSFGWVPGSGTFTTTNTGADTDTQVTVVFLFFADGVHNDYRAIAADVDEVSLTCTAPCIYGSASKAYVSSKITTPYTNSGSFDQPAINLLNSGASTNITIVGSRLDAVGTTAGSVYVTPAGGGSSVNCTNIVKHGTAPNVYLTADVTLPAAGTYNLTIVSPLGGSCGNKSATLYAALVAQTGGLIINGDFEAGSVSPWGEFGFGGAGDPVGGLNTPSGVFGFTPPYAGSYSWGLGKVTPNSGPHGFSGLYQQITLPAGPAGEQFQLAFDWRLEANSGTGTFEAGVVPGFAGGDFNAPIGTTSWLKNPAVAKITTSTPTSAFVHQTLNFVRPTASGKITVYFQAKGEGAGVNYAMWLDNVNLTDLGTTCSGATTVTTFNVVADEPGLVAGKGGHAKTLPAQTISVANFVGTRQKYRITGTGLSRVTNIAFVDGSGYIVAPVIGSHSDTEITAYTDAAADGSLTSNGLSLVLPGRPATYMLELQTTGDPCGLLTCVEGAPTVVADWGDPGDVRLSGVRLAQASCNGPVSPSYASDQMAMSSKSNTSFKIELFGNEDVASTGSVMSGQGWQVVRAIRLVKHSNHVTPAPATPWANPDSVYCRYDANDVDRIAGGGCQRTTATLDLSGLTLEAGYYDLQVLWNGNGTKTTHPGDNLNPGNNTYSVSGDRPPAFLVYATATLDPTGTWVLPANPDFENPEPGTGNTVIGCPTPNASNQRPKDWDTSRGINQLKRDGAFMGPACDSNRNRAFNTTNDHYVGLDEYQYVNLDMGFFQTLDVSAFLDGSKHLNRLLFDVRAEMTVNSDAAGAHGYINLYDGPPVGTPILHQQMPDALVVDSVSGSGLATDPTLVASLAVGTPISTGLLSVEFEMTTANAPSNSAMWVDNVRIGPYHRWGCNTPWADLNGDGFVDMLDFAQMQLCLTQGVAGPASITAGCGCADPSGDGSINGTDVSSFLQCASGPKVPWAPTVNCP